MSNFQSIKHSVALCCAAFVALLSSDSNAQITSLGSLPGSDSLAFASDVSGDGTTVVGSARDAEGVTRMIRWTAEEGLVNLDDGSGGRSSADSVSYDGSVIVGDQSGESVRWTSENGFTSLNASGLVIEAVSGDGNVIVGTRRAGISRSEAFRWTAATGVVGLGSLDVNPSQGESFAKGVSFDGSVIVGRTTTDSLDFGPPRGFRWTEADGMADLGAFESDLSSDVSDVSYDGSVISGDGLIRIFGSDGLEYGVEGARWTERTGLEGIGFIPGTTGGSGSLVSISNAISGDGNTIGGFTSTLLDGGGVLEGGAAYLWTEETGIVSLYDLLQQQGHDVSAWGSLDFVTGISQDGSVIVGSGTGANGTGFQGFVARLDLNAVPEPGSTIFMLAILGPVAARRRNRIA
jgi:probable HAF family extracellular repeat protein